MAIYSPGKRRDTESCGPRTRVITLDISTWKLRSWYHDPRKQHPDISSMSRSVRRCFSRVEELQD